MRQRLRDVATSLAVIVVVALGARVGFGWDQARKIPREALATAPFEQETGSIAHALVTGKGFSNPFLKDTGPTAWLTPVYPLLVAATFKILGVFTLSSFFFLFFFNAICSSAVCLPLYYVGKRVAGVGAGALAAWLWAVFPSAVMMPFEWIWDTSLAAFLAAALLWATLELPERELPLTRNWLLYGLLWGFTLMVNPSVGSLLPFYLGWAAYRWRKREAERSNASGSAPHVQPALALMVAILCCVPWTVRNYVVFHRLVPLRSNFALELYIGNNGYSARWVNSALHPNHNDEELAEYERVGEAAYMHHKSEQAKAFIRSHPGWFAWMTLRRIVYMWTGYWSCDHAYLKDEPLDPPNIFVDTTMSILALLGLRRVFQRNSSLAMRFAIVLVFFPLAYYFSHPETYYFRPVDPLIVVLAAVTVAAGNREPAAV